MSWEHSITFAFIGASLVIAFIGNSIKDDENNIRWTRFLPIGIRTLLYFVSLGLVMFAIGIQGPIMIENGINVGDSGVNTTLALRSAVTGGVTVTTTLFYSLIVILSIFAIVIIIERILLRRKGGDSYDDY